MTCSIESRDCLDEVEWHLGELRSCTFDVDSAYKRCRRPCRFRCRATCKSRKSFKPSRRLPLAGPRIQISFVWINRRSLARTENTFSGYRTLQHNRPPRRGIMGLNWAQWAFKHETVTAFANGSNHCPPSLVTDNKGIVFVKALQPFLS